jgi:membrane-associated HD superfamily phosphohydrolase
LFFRLLIDWFHNHPFWKLLISDFWFSTSLDEIPIATTDALTKKKEENDSQQVEYLYLYWATQEMHHFFPVALCSQFLISVNFCFVLKTRIFWAPVISLDETNLYLFIFNSTFICLFIFIIYLFIYFNSKFLISVNFCFVLKTRIFWAPACN